MKIDSSERKLNNEGFSLMELIVVMAIMIVLAATAAVTVSMLDSSYVEDAERGIKDYLAMARTKSMSVAATDWYMSIGKEGSDYYAYIYKVDTKEINTGGVISYEYPESLLEKKKLGAKISITYVNGSGSAVDITSSNKLKIYFDSATGKVKKIMYGSSEQTMSSTGIGYIGIARNDYDINLKVFYNTGKCERE